MLVTMPLSYVVSIAAHTAIMVYLMLATTPRLLPVNMGLVTVLIHYPFDHNNMLSR